MSFSRKAIAVSAVLLLVYVCSFLVLRYTIIPSYEITRPPDRHWLRPVYEPFYYPVRWLDANSWSILPPEPRTLTGTARDVSRNRLALDQDDGSMIASGFVCEPSACALLDGVARGAKIEVTFGAALVGGRDTFVNRLLNVRTGDLVNPNSALADWAPDNRKLLGVWTLLRWLAPWESIAPWPQSGVFAGYYKSGFELSYFKPAGTRERWWVARGIGIAEAARCATNPCYLVFRGQLSKRGPHGHMSAYEREVIVTEVLELRNLGSDENIVF